MKRYRNRGRWVVLMMMSALFFTSMLPGFAEAAERETFKLRLATGHPLTKGTSWIVALDQFFIPEVKKRVLERTTKYDIEIKGFYGGSLAKLGEVLETVETGLADVGYVLPLAEMAKIDPYNLTFWIPFSTPDIAKVLRAYSKTVDHFPVFEQVLTKVNQRLVGHAFGPQDSYELISNVSVKRMEDMKGKKFAHAGSFLPLIAALGATPVQAVYTDIYTSMDTGVFNGFTIPATSAVAFKIQEVGKYFIKCNLGAMMAGAVTVNLNTWKKLPKEVQDIMIQVGDEYTWDVIKRLNAYEVEALAEMKKAKVNIIELSKEEKARWAKTVNDAGVIAKTIGDCQAKGNPCGEIARFYIKALEEEGYKLPYTPRLR